MRGTSSGLVDRAVPPVQGVTSRRRGAWPGVLCTGVFSLQRGDTCDSAWLSLCHLESLPPLRLHKSQEDVTHRSPPASLSLLSRGVTPTSSAWRSRPPGHCGRHPCLEGLPSTLHLMPTTPPPPHSPKATPGFPTRAQPGLELLDSRDPFASTSRVAEATKVLHHHTCLDSKCHFCKKCSSATPGPCLTPTRKLTFLVSLSNGC
jgi:hypothetical protein